VLACHVMARKREDEPSTYRSSVYDRPSLSLVDHLLQVTLKQKQQRLGQVVVIHSGLTNRYNSPTYPFGES
jgi:hypothetical protein